MNKEQIKQQVTEAQAQLISNMPLMALIGGAFILICILLFIFVVRRLL